MTNEKTLDKNPDDNLDQTNISDKEIKESEEKSSPEEVILNLEDKLTRSFAEMENQRRRFEKEKEDAFHYGGFTFAREALNLLDNLERSKESLQNDETLKNTDALKKISEHLNIIHNDMINIFKKNGIEPIIALNKKLDPNIHQAMIEIQLQPFFFHFQIAHSRPWRELLAEYMMMRFLGILKALLYIGQSCYRVLTFSSPFAVYLLLHPRYQHILYLV